MEDRFYGVTVVLVMVLTSKQTPPATFSVQLRHYGERKGKFLGGFWITCLNNSV